MTNSMNRVTMNEIMTRHQIRIIHLAVWLLFVLPMPFRCMTVFAAEAIPDEVPIIPRRHLFDHPQISLVRLSPDGTRIGYLASEQGQQVLTVKSIQTEDLQLFSETVEYRIAALMWTPDSSHILFLADREGNENYVIYGTNIQTGLITRYTPQQNVSADIIACDPTNPARILIALNSAHPQYHDAYSLNLDTRELFQVTTNPGTVMSWIADAQGRILAALNSTEDGMVDLMIRPAEKEEWRRLIRWTDNDMISSNVVGFSKDSKSVLVRDSSDCNTARLVRIELESGSRTVMASDQNNDIEEVLIHPSTKELQAYQTNRQFREWHLTDPDIKADFDILKSFRDGHLRVVDRSADDEVWLIEFSSDTRPPGFYIYHRKTGQIDSIGSTYPVIEKYILAPTIPFECRARDGLQLNGYITFPPTVRKTGLPLVLRVHGGPYARDSWEYNPEIQWLANRGFVCLQVNYRGSTGYGKEFINASRREWGGKMHDDLIDTVSWAVSQGIADPARIAIMGASYGGYAALLGATFTPDVFRCAISAMGPSNLVTFLKSIPAYWSPQRRFLFNRIGDPDTERDFLLSRSPISRVDNIKIPILLAQGANDARVRHQEGGQIIDAIRQKGLRYRYLEFTDEGHRLSKVENRLKFYAACERFLAVNLQGRLEEPAY